MGTRAEIASSVKSGTSIKATDIKASRKAVAAASMGNALEWYDFTIYALFAVYIAKNFFPGGNETVELIKSFLAFGLGFLIRPLGAVVLGIYADKAGRKSALFLTIMIMAVGTLLIAVAPTYAAIGIGAPLIIMAGRVLQGFSAGGEVGSAAAFLVEHAPEGQKGKYAAWLQASMAFSNIIGAFVALAVTSLLTEDQVGDWGWRIPFILGLLIAPVGLWMRRSLDETPAFRAELNQKSQLVKEHAPLKEIFGPYRLALIKGTAFSVLWAASVYVMIIYMPIYVQRAFGFTGTQAFIAALIGNALMAVGCIVAGSISDKIGRRQTLIFTITILLVAIHPLIWWLHSEPTLQTLIIVQSSFCLMVAGVVGVAPSALSELFPTHVRSTGMSLAYNISTTIFGGFAPAALTWLGTTSLGYTAPAWYVSIAALVALVAVWSMKTKLETH